MPRPKNYIHRLQADLADRDAKLAAVIEELNHLRKSLDGPKYTGVDSDGARKDWMATTDLGLWIERIRVSALFTEAEPAPEPVRCTSCGEADRSKGEHGIGRCT